MDNVCCATEQTKVSSSKLEAAVHSLSFLDSNQYCTFFTFCSAVGALEAMWWLTAYQWDWNFNGNAQIWQIFYRLHEVQTSRALRKWMRIYFSLLNLRVNIKELL